MNVFSKAYCRCYQKGMFVAAKFLDFGHAPVIQGHDCVAQLIEYMLRAHLRRPFVVVDPALQENEGVSIIHYELKKAGLRPTFFYDVVPNPTFTSIEHAADKYVSFTCDCFIAIGGGSSIDLAKAAALKVAYPKKRLSHFKGLLHVHRRLPTLIAIPTTAGTGSEATLAAVVLDEERKDKFQIDDPKLIPNLIVFYPRLLAGLPQKVIAATGMDALTHAVEAYIGKSNVKSTRNDALLAVKGINEYLVDFQKNPDNERLALAMLDASYHAGKAFTRAYVGYVHALAHALGGTYGTAHGLANAVLLPIVLRLYGKSVYKPLSELADAISLTPPEFSKAEKALSFIAYIENLNRRLGLPRQLDHLIQKDDLLGLAWHAMKEGNPLYPVPKLWTKEDFVIALKQSDNTWGYR